MTDGGSKKRVRRAPKNEAVQRAKPAALRDAALQRARPSRRSSTRPSDESHAPPALLAGGNPQIAKGAGDGPVQAYLAAMPGWKQEIGRRLDALISAAAPGVRKAVKWNSPLYGSSTSAEPQEWFLSFHCFSRYVKVAFLRGAALTPLPPGASKQDEVRYLDIYEDWRDARGEKIDTGQFAAWVEQANAMPGVRM